MDNLKVGTKVQVSFLGETRQGFITGKNEDGYMVEVFRTYMKNGQRQTQTTRLNSVKNKETKGFSSYIISVE